MGETWEVKGMFFWGGICGYIQLAQWFCLCIKVRGLFSVFEYCFKTRRDSWLITLENENAGCTICM